MIVPGTRYGQEGSIRVCVLCQDKGMDSDDDDDDDRRSIASSLNSSFAAHQLGSVEPRSLARGNIPQSPFAASHLFGRSDSFSLFSIAETKRPHSGSDESGFGSRPATPADDIHGIRSDFVPFRRALSDDDPVSLSDRFKHDYSPGNGSKTPVDFPRMIPIQNEGTSTIAFPVSSPADPGFGPETPSMSRSRINSFADFDGPLRSRVQSRLEYTEPWRQRRESTA